MLERGETCSPIAVTEADSGMFVMFGRTAAPQKVPQTGQRMSDSSATFSDLCGPLDGVLRHLQVYLTTFYGPGWLCTYAVLPKYERCGVTYFCFPEDKIYSMASTFFYRTGPNRV